VNVTTNADQLVRQVLAGEVWPALADRHAYRVGPDGQPFVLPGMGGMTLGVHCGGPATGYASDHLEPGASIRHADPAANMAVQFLTCVGNEVTVTSGPAAGATGHVIGQHAYVLVDFAEAEAAELTTGDTVSIAAVGQGLALTEHPRIGVKNCSPGLIDAMPGGTTQDGGLEVHVAARIPAEAMGAGVGMISEYANTDLMGAYAGLSDDLSLGLESLRVGDIVAIADHDHRFGRGYRPGYLTIGVISTGQCMLFGHGPGPSSLLSGPADAFTLVDDPAANLATWYHGSGQRAGSPAGGGEKS
jgi:Domain of unknown function (DUF4438)